MNNASSLAGCPIGAWLAGLHWGTVAEFITAAATVGIVWVAFVQLQGFNRQVRADFTYKVYADLRQWLRTHPDAKAWVDKPDATPLDDHYDDWELDEFLTYFEAVWGLWQRKLVDRDLVYDLLSDDLIAAYEANNGALGNVIREIRSEEPSDHDVFIGVEKLYREMKEMTDKRNPPPRP